MAQILKSKPVAESLEIQFKNKVASLPVQPKLVVLLVGQDPASQTYVRNKSKKCLELGMEGETRVLDSKISQSALLEQVQLLNEDKSVHAILVQLPLPRHLDPRAIMEAIHPLKDVDCFHPINQGLLYQGRPRFTPCTPLGIIELIEYYGFQLESKNAVVVGRSEIVGKPMAHLLLAKNATVTLCHSKTTDLQAVTSSADVVVVAAGLQEGFGKEYFSKGQLVIDVGIHRRVDGKLCGDVNFSEVEPLVGAITPVPGGVGPLTISSLMNNVLLAASLQT